MLAAELQQTGVWDGFRGPSLGDWGIPGWALPEEHSIGVSWGTGASNSCRPAEPSRCICFTSLVSSETPSVFAGEARH